VFVEQPFEITRRPVPAQKHFVCVVCQRAAATDPWRKPSGPGDDVVCVFCTLHGYRRGLLDRASYADRIALGRVNALILALNWEIMNGPYA
jgi:hypothetical protein